MKELLQSAIGDGAGQTSMMRITVFMMVAAVIGAKFVNLFVLKIPIVWDTQDIAILSLAVGSKLVQNTQEK